MREIELSYAAYGREEDRETITVEAFDGSRHSPDLIALKHLEIRHYQEVSGENDFSDIMDSQAELRNIEKSYTESGGQFFVAARPCGEIIGFVGLQPEAGAATLKRLAVVPGYRRCGIGACLVGSAVDWARQKGFFSVRLATGFKEQAKGIYHRHGFVEIGRDEESQDFIMELDFSA